MTKTTEAPTPARSRPDPEEATLRAVLENYRTQFGAARAKFAATLTDPLNVVYTLEWGAADLIEAAELSRMAETVLAAEREGTWGSLTDLLREYGGRVQDEVNDAAITGATSSSPMANLSKARQAAAKARFLRDLRLRGAVGQ